MWCIRHHGLVQSFKSHLHGARLHASLIQHVLETDPGPERIAHRAVRPFPAGHARLKESSRVAGALVHGGQLNARQSVKDVIERQRQCLVDMAAHRKAELANINIGRDDRPVPAYIELVVGSEYTLVENLKRGFQERWTGPLQDHRPFLRKAGGDLPRPGTAGQRQINHTLRPCRL